uniref:SUN domain-containing protein n=2 Tax=Caenorhabditis tropicalis TaxID=1561998 RepID=A0A1I7THR9_9PELO
MNETESTKEDVESAYGSEVTFNSDSLLKKEMVSVQTSTRNMWRDLLIDRVRSYSIEQWAGAFILFLILMNSYANSSDIKNTHFMILTLQQKVYHLQKAFEAFKMEKEESSQMGNEMIKERINEALNEEKTLFVSENVEKTVENQTCLTPKPIYKINAASYVMGAEVDTSRSSNSSLYRFFGDESEQVLIDRLEPPAKKAWCSEDKEPILTVNLAEFIKPTAISYQHFKWNHIVPHGAPQIFDVLACLDFSCEQTVPLVSNAEYKSNDKKQEQIYPIAQFPNASLIGKVQFRFRKNHGNVKETCVSLVRVYGETDQLPKKEEPTLRKLEYCSSLKYDYHNNPLSYRYGRIKDCKKLYSYGCCSICPECYEDCPIVDVESLGFGLLIFFIFTVIACLLAFLANKYKK